MSLFNLYAKLSLDSSAYDRGVKEATASGKSLASTLGKGLASAAKIGAAAIASVGAGLVALGRIGVDYNAQIESYTMGLTTLLGTAEEANKVINNIKEDAAKTPFDVAGLVQANQLLIGAGVSAENARETILALGDAVSATGGGNNELSRMAANLQQIKNVGVASAIDIKQFAMAGINIYKIMADYLGVTTEEVKDLQINYDDLSAALIKAASAGGIYEGAMQRQSKTFKGLVSTLKDNAKALVGEVFQPISQGLISSVLPEVNKGLEQLATAYKTGGTKALLKSAGSVLANVVNYITSRIPDLTSVAMTLTGAFAEGILDGLPKILSSITQSGAAVASQLLSPSTISKVFDALSTAAFTLVEQLLDVAPELYSQFINGSLTLLEKLLSEDFFGKLVELMINIPSALVEAFMKTDWIDVGKPIIKSIWNGVKNLGKTLVESDKGWLPSIISGTTKQPETTTAETAAKIEERLKEYRTGDTTVVLEVDGEVFGKAVYKSNQKQSQIYGTKLAGVAT